MRTRWRGLAYRKGAAQLWALGVATIVDLRTTAEVERRGRFPFEEHGIAYRHRPLLEVSAAELDANESRRPLHRIDESEREAR